MFLKSAKVGPFKSIDAPVSVEIEEKTTALVGMNEAGKTVFLRALEKSRDAAGGASFKPVDDYPRKDLPPYLRVHKTTPAEVVALSFSLTDDERAEFSEAIGTSVENSFRFTLRYNYANGLTVNIPVDDRSALKEFVTKQRFSAAALGSVKKATSFRELVSLLEAASLTDDDKIELTALKERVSSTKWDSVAQWEAWGWLKPRTPKFLYFSDYDLLPSKMNLADLAARVEQAKTDPSRLQPSHRGVLSLLRMADIGVEDFANPGGYEELKAKIEGVSINLTDQIMEFWKQNENLEVEVDIKADAEDEAPFDSGPNLYLRIKNRRHRGVSTPFQQRSRGFIWFFSFLVWFNSVQYATGGNEKQPLILLLDEPGLALHALAQSDFLRYIDQLSSKHQVIYSTHSPFMIHSDRLHEVRVVEDRDRIGTVISGSIRGSDPRTIFPLQAALGWTIAQNLFISKRNLLVEGPSDLIYLKWASSMLEASDRTGLRDDVTIVPAGGLDKVATFVALLGANKLELVVLHDFRGTPDQRLTDLVREKLIAGKLVLNVSQFRSTSTPGPNGPATDTEDLFDPGMYLDYFNKAYGKQLGATKLDLASLPKGDRVIDRIERYIASASILVRPTGGFNHYHVANAFVSSPPASPSADTLTRFENLFKAVNALF